MKTIYLLEGLSCAHCANQIESAVSKLQGVQSAYVNFITQRLSIEYDPECQIEVEQSSERIVRKTEPGVRLKSLLVLKK